MMGITLPAELQLTLQGPIRLIEFWRRWHMTLSRFLRDNLYIPLGGNRKGPARRHINILMGTCCSAASWHGAGLNFAIWGALYGVGLVLNHLWRDIAAKADFALPRPLARAATLLLVLFAWAPFRADTMRAAVTIWEGMVGMSGLGVAMTTNTYEAAALIAALGAIALVAPNTQEILSLDWRKPVATRWRWQPSTAWAIAVGCLFGIAVAGTLTKPTAFLYFRF